MKKQSIIAQGHCGLTVELNLVDQYRLTDELVIIDKADAEINAIQDWEQARNEARNKGEDWKKRDELAKVYETEHPKPEQTITPDRLNQAHMNILKFVRKFVLDGDRVSNIFDDEE